ncbi:hypothetical protein A2U01_0072025, partial [Trifolium medium]|nr:hypothetical protein [Trifolium medium]
MPLFVFLRRSLVPLLGPRRSFPRRGVVQCDEMVLLFPPGLLLRFRKLVGMESPRLWSVELF